MKKVLITLTISALTSASAFAGFERCHVRCVDARNNFQHIKHECLIIGSKGAIETVLEGYVLDRQGRGSHNPNYNLDIVKNDGSYERVYDGTPVLIAKEVCFKVRDSVLKKLSDLVESNECEAGNFKIEDIANTEYIGMSGDLDSLSRPCMHLGN